MATVQMSVDRKNGSVTASAAPRALSESVADQVLACAAIIGALSGAVCGTVLGARIETEFPIAWGMFGTMLGSGLFAGGWCRLARFWAGHENRDTART